MVFLRAFLGSMLLAVLPLSALSQITSGSITGTVVTTDKGPIRAATVVIAGSGEHEVHTNDAGRFEVNDLPPGTYVVRAFAQGFIQLSGRTIDVRAGLRTSIVLELSGSTSSLSTIGTVTTTRGEEALSTSSAPSRELNAQRYAARGYASVAQMLADSATSVTVIRTASGSPNGPAVAALRGPDPTETLIDLDWHSINSGGTGAFDLAMLDPATLCSVQLIYGISPSSLIGPNTIDGAINIRTIEPTEMIQ